MPHAELILQLRGVSKDYRGLRPLRIEQLELRRGQVLALLGFDQAMAEVLLDLITGASVPDAGEVTVFGSPTTAINDADTWSKNLDLFGLLTDRAVLVEQFTAEQNLAMSLSLEVEDMPVALRTQVRQLAEEVGLPAVELTRPTVGLSSVSRLRIRLGRALALRPRLLLAEHPNASLAPEEAPAFAADFSRIVAARGVATLVLTADRTFASAVSEIMLTLEPATGALEASSGWRRWFR